MSMTNVTDKTSEHTDIWLLIPWYVNDRIEATDRRRTDTHLRACAACRNELLLQQSIYGTMANDGTIEHMPQASLRRLQQRLDRDAPRRLQPRPRLSSGRMAARWRGAWRPSVMAASIAIMVGAIGAAIILSNPLSRHSNSSNYYTVTDATPRTNNAVIRAVFIPTITLTELQFLLDESKLRIAAGPTEAGVYSLVATTSQPVSVSLARLRKDPAVRFAESVQFTAGQHEPR